MRRAINRDAVHREEFYFRKCLISEGDVEEKLITGTEEAAPSPPSVPHSIDSEYTLMSVNTIMNGKVRTCMCLWPGIHVLHFALYTKCAIVSVACIMLSHTCIMHAILIQYTSKQDL